MWIAWVVLVLALAVVGFLLWRMRPAMRKLGDNYFDRRPRFKRAEVEHVRAALTHNHNQLLPYHQQVTKLDNYLAPAVTVAALAFAWALAATHWAVLLSVIAALAAGAGDQVENRYIREILASPQRPVPQEDVRPLAIATTVKFAGYIVSIVVSLLIGVQLIR